MYLGLDPDGDGPLQPIYEPRESLQWMFRETTDTVVELTDEEWAAVAELGGTDVASVFATYGRVESAYRRFDVYCVGTQGSGTTTNSLVTSTLVSIRDVFWDPYARIGTLWTGLQLGSPGGVDGARQRAVRWAAGEHAGNSADRRAAVEDIRVGTVHVSGLDLSVGVVAGLAGVRLVVRSR